MRLRDAVLVLALVAAGAGAFLLLRGRHERPTDDEARGPGDERPLPPPTSSTAPGPDQGMEAPGPSSAAAPAGNSAVPATLRGDASIVGRVESGTGEPVDGATVFVNAELPQGEPPSEPPTSPWAGATMKTDAGGRFRLSGLAATRWAVRAEKQGHGPAGTRVVTLSKDAAGPGADVVLRLATLGWILGEVFDGEERLVGPARVLFSRGRAKPADDAPPTDDVVDPHAEGVEVRAGRFQTGPLPAGSWDLVRVEGVGDRVAEAPTSAIVSDGQASQPVVIRLTSGARLVGEVRDTKSGEPIAGAKIDVLLEGNPVTGGERTGIATTGPDGRYEIRRLAAGAAIVRASAEGRAPDVGRADLPRGGEATRSFRLDRPAQLRIRVVDDRGRPIAKALVGLERDAGPVATAESASMRRLTVEYFRRENAMPATGEDGSLVLHVSAGPLRITAQRYYGRGMVAMTEAEAKAGESVEATVTIPIGK